jgi:hypothetical protein
MDDEVDWVQLALKAKSDAEVRERRLQRERDERLAVLVSLLVGTVVEAQYGMDGFFRLEGRRGNAGVIMVFKFIDEEAASLGIDRRCLTCNEDFMTPVPDRAALGAILRQWTVVHPGCKGAS